MVYTLLDHRENDAIKCQKHGSETSHLWLVVLQSDLYIINYNGHPRDFRKWPLNTGGRLIQA